MESERSYTEREVAEIVRRAGELQAKGTEAAPKGFRSSDLRRMAEELGIDPRYVDQAMAEGQTSKPGRFGLSSSIDRIYEGEPDFDQLGEMVALNQSFRRHSTHQVGNVFVTTFSRGLGTYTVTIRRTSGQTHIRVRSVSAFPVIIGFFLSFYGLMAVMATLDNYRLLTALNGLLSVVLVLGTVLLALRPSVQSIHKRTAEILEEFAGCVQPAPTVTAAAVEQPEDLRQRIQG